MQVSDHEGHEFYWVEQGWRTYPATVRVEDGEATVVVDYGRPMSGEVTESHLRCDTCERNDLGGALSAEEFGAERFYAEAK